jgi:hypothetical protein
VIRLGPLFEEQGEAVREYSPKRRTAVVFAGSGTAGAYHAGALKALDESGVKVDLVVGTGIGAFSAACAAVSSGPRLYTTDGLWSRISRVTVVRPRTLLVAIAAILGLSFAIFLLPLLVGLLLGILSTVLLIVDRFSPGVFAAFLAWMTSVSDQVSSGYVAALAVPGVLISLLVLGFVVWAWVAKRRRVPELFETALSTGPARTMLLESLWEVARGTALTGRAPSAAELGKRYVGLLVENLGQPGFRELVLRTADLETGEPLLLHVLSEEHKTRFATARRRRDGALAPLDLSSAGAAEVFFEAVLAGFVPAPAGTHSRVVFPKGTPRAGEVRRLGDGMLVGGAGLGEAIAAGAEQIVLVTAVPETAFAPRVRRGLWASLGAMASALERQAVSRDLDSTERLNRIIETLGHDTPDGLRAWQDPATGRTYRWISLWVIRPERRSLGPLDLDGSQEPTTEVVDEVVDLVEQGYKDACRQFVEPVVGAAPVQSAGANADRVVEL